MDRNSNSGYEQCVPVHIHNTEFSFIQLSNHTFCILHFTCNYPDLLQTVVPAYLSTSWRGFSTSQVMLRTCWAASSPHTPCQLLSSSSSCATKVGLIICVRRQLNWTGSGKSLTLMLFSIEQKHTKNCSLSRT